MILVDRSVWIAHFRGIKTSGTAKLVALAPRQKMLVGDLVLLEVLQGARSEVDAARIERALRRYTIVRLLNADLAVRAARNYRTLRRAGITMRKSADLIIATYCIEHAHMLLHEDRDFDPMVSHLGLVAI